MWSEEPGEVKLFVHHERAVELVSEEARAYPVGLPGSKGSDFGAGAL